MRMGNDAWFPMPANELPRLPGTLKVPKTHYAAHTNSKSYSTIW